MQNNTRPPLGIWLDHSSADLIKIKGDQAIHTIHSDFTHDTKTDALQRSEHILHNKEQQMDEAFYKAIGAEILKCDHVLLFGPTNAKFELHNYLSKDKHYQNIQIDIQSADNMSDNEKRAFVTKHFDAI